MQACTLIRWRCGGRARIQVPPSAPVCPNRTWLQCLITNSESLWKDNLLLSLLADAAAERGAPPSQPVRPGHHRKCRSLVCSQTSFLSCGCGCGCRSPRQTGLMQDQLDPDFALIQPCALRQSLGPLPTRRHEVATLPQCTHSTSLVQSSGSPTRRRRLLRLGRGLPRLAHGLLRLAHGLP